ncbi:hypothetical protein LB516_10255 [Mesorhizobium sp. CO1-1-7]|uniref:hypothetical protein n=1 Tax=Mesorhizobium TaxID=68287 RepID=UPI00068409CF|nr:MULTISPECIES: hypothetical protein [Mesorhizobium]MBZ9930726.1 hypothetical protein [Mesorhizobium sp. BR1-1-5]MBZ9695939.1 hypothetical protein [Mesorhizobium sp. CO1-1-9]MBZ9745628.1 hypothetical protein [Mesorhizobium sp. CO1-1-7]MBZ9757614.1 hypothetical protein [Mesorhizobium sp. ESP6-5]MBZ9908870.1 hypothetical protein [Mesorhizobium sp. BR115XR7A]
MLSRRRTNQRTTQVSEPTVAEATENIYASLRADNADIDAHIATLKAALAREGIKQAVFDPAKLAQSNRSGRKLMQAYFRQRGVSVTFSD